VNTSVSTATASLPPADPPATPPVDPAGGGVRRRRSKRDWAVDIVCFLLALSGVGSGVVAKQFAAPDAPVAGSQSGWWLAVDLGLGMVAASALWWRRRWPVALTVAVVLCGSVSASSSTADLILLFTVAVHRRHTVALLLAAARLGVDTVRHIVWHDPYPLWLVLGLSLAYVAPVVFWGMLVRARRQLVTSLRERTRRAVAEQRLRVAQAQHLERARIAREMHDVLAHRISLLSLHAGALEYAADAPGTDVARAAGVIRGSAHAAMQDLRQVIGVLSADAPDGEPDPTASERPLPCLTDVPALVEESRTAGIRVDLDDRVTDPGGVPEQIGRAAYRIVQEGLTNARKHAPGTLVTVTLTGAPGTGLTIDVHNPPPVGHLHPARSIPGSGTGLVGVAERVHLAGGTVTHGPDPAGGFRLTATLPWPADVRARR
jgi:signal transduction histidine kinase